MITSRLMIQTSTVDVFPKASLNAVPALATFSDQQFNVLVIICNLLWIAQNISVRSCLSLVSNLSKNAFFNWFLFCFLDNHSDVFKTVNFSQKDWRCCDEWVFPQFFKILWFQNSKLAPCTRHPLSRVNIISSFEGRGYLYISRSGGLWKGVLRD